MGTIKSSCYNHVQDHDFIYEAIVQKDEVLPLCSITIQSYFKSASNGVGKVDQTTIFFTREEAIGLAQELMDAANSIVYKDMKS